MLTLTLLNSHLQTPIAGLPPDSLPVQWQFDQEEIVRIGRSSSNDVVVQHDRVSRHHAELRRVGASPPQWQLVNMGKNGTWLNGQPVTETPVSNGSLIQLAVNGPILQLQIPLSPEAREQTLACQHPGNGSDNLFCIHCGQPINVKFTRREYQVLQVLGQGGMGTTYLVWHQKLEVLKEMNADMAHIAKAQELFEREARILSSLQHPGIPRFSNFFVEGDKKYLAMELIPGQDLERYVAKHGPATAAQAIDWASQTCNILTYLHGHEPPIIHRDIKPANLMLRHRDQRIVLLDFGAVKEIGTPPGTRIGAEGYTAPEQERGRPLTQSDLYSIGATLIFLLTGKLPQKFYKKMGDYYRFRVDGVNEIPPALRSVIEKATEPRPIDRYISAQDLATALQNCL